jgi:hypothetical protein
MSAEGMPQRQSDKEKYAHSEDVNLQELLNDAVKQIESLKVGEVGGVMEVLIKKTPTKMIDGASLKTTDGKPMRRVVTYSGLDENFQPKIETQWGPGVADIVEGLAVLENAAPIKYPAEHPRFAGQEIFGTYDEMGVFTPDPENKTGERLMNRYVTMDAETIYGKAPTSEWNEYMKVHPVFSIGIPTASPLVGKVLVTKEGLAMTLESGGALLFNVTDKEVDGKTMRENWRVSTAQYISPHDLADTYMTREDYLAQ